MAKSLIDSDIYIDFLQSAEGIMGLWAIIKNVFGRKKQETAPAPTLKERLLATDDALMIEPGGERIYNRDFRYPHDSPHLIRLFQESPGGRTYKRDVTVAGIVDEPARSNAAALIRGMRRAVTLQRDPSNPPDRAAIRVIGSWYDASGTQRSGQVGWVPKEVARALAKTHPNAQLDATIWKMFKPVDGKSPGLRIDIWCHQASGTADKPRGRRKSRKKPNGAAQGRPLGVNGKREKRRGG